MTSADLRPRECVFTYINNDISFTKEIPNNEYIGNICDIIRPQIRNPFDLVYKEHGKDFVKQLDGEYAILLLDFDGFLDYVNDIQNVYIIYQKYNNYVFQELVFFFF